MSSPLQRLSQHPLVFHRSTSPLARLDFADTVQIALQKLNVLVVDIINLFGVKSILFTIVKFCHSLLSYLIVNCL